MRWIVPFVLLATPCFCEQAAKPPCNAQNRGRFWPEQANTDSATARAASRSGDLQICTLGTWKYQWASLSVHVGQLGKGKGKVSGPGSKHVKASAPQPSAAGAGHAETPLSEGEPKP